MAGRTTEILISLWEMAYNLAGQDMQTAWCEKWAKPATMGLCSNFYFYSLE